MALVTRVLRDERALKSTHPTQVECLFVVGETDGKKLLQLNTYGSDAREIPDKLSQTLQFNETSARELWELLSLEFGFSERVTQAP